MAAKEQVGWPTGDGGAVILKIRARVWFSSHAQHLARQRTGRPLGSFSAYHSGWRFT